MTFAVQRGRIVTTFGRDLDAAYQYWCVCLGSVLLYRALGWRREEKDRDLNWSRLVNAS